MSRRTFEFEMTPESGVALNQLKTRKGYIERSPLIHQYVETFARFKIGQSFFVSDVSRADLEFLRQPFISAGLNAVFRETQCDPVHQVQGVRVWRQYGEYDEL